MRSIRLVYLNGHAEDLQFEQTLRPGQEIDIDLRGERNYLRAIEMNYRSKFGVSIGSGGIRVNKASIKVFGDNVRGGPGPGGRPPGAGRDVPPGWLLLASERFDRRDDRVEIRVGRREGRLGQIRLRYDGEPIRVREIRIRFGNGETQNIRVDQELRDGDLTRPIDLEGERRFIETVTIRMEGQRRPGPAAFTLIGTERAGRDDGAGGPPGRGDWVSLGKKNIGFGVDRDVIRVGQSEEWFRDRGFDKLHFVAENNEIEMISIRVVYLNGQAEDYRVNRLIPAGGDLAVDLPGSRSYIREIEMIYKGRPGFRGRSVLSVFGEPSPRRR
jgi:hypothetical protein